MRLFSSFKKQHVLFLVLSMLTGLIGSFVYPLMSFFIVDGLGSPPIYIGIYMVLVTLSGLVFSQWLGNLADRGMSTRNMYIIALLGMITALIIYANTNSFWWVLFAGTVFMSMGAAAIPQMLTLSRQWAGKEGVNITKFNSSIRAAISFAWIGGPPLAFTLAATLGFGGSFYLAAICAAIAIGFVLYFIPDYSTPGASISGNNDKKKNTAALPISFWLLGIAVALGSVSNIMYSSSLPLYTLKELALPDYSPGLLMGLVAFLEIPVMLYSARLAEHFHKAKLMVFSFVCAAIFYVSIFFATELWHFIALQFVNALFYGVYAGVGLTLMQDQLPNRIGFTSAYYSNAMKLGMMIGTSGTGLIAQFFSFRYANLGSLTAAMLAILCLVGFGILKQIENNRSTSAHSPYPQPL